MLIHARLLKIQKKTLRKGYSHCTRIATGMIRHTTTEHCYNTLITVQHGDDYCTRMIDVAVTPCIQSHRNIQQSNTRQQHQNYI